MIKARIISSHGRNYTALSESNIIWQCYARGKKKEACVGDYVLLSEQGEQQARIEEIIKRKNLLFRSDSFRSKQFAANIDLLLYVVATEPHFSEEMISRALAGAWAEDIKVIIILNKCDLHQELAYSQKRLAVFQELGVQIIECSTLKPNELKNNLLPYIKDKTVLLLGQSAMGKSSILNVLYPEAQAATQEHSKALGSGKHTTTHSRLYSIPKFNLDIIDSPGFQAFGLAHLKEDQIIKGFPEFTPYLEQCRFSNCKHLKEPGCAITEAVNQEAINLSRYILYEKLIEEKLQQTHW